MRSILLALAIALMAAPAMGDYYVAGGFNGWNAAGDLMTDTGGGVYTVTLALNPGDRYEFKVTDGTWAENWPWSGNSWFIAPADGIVTLTYDTNTYSDGWVGSTKRIGVSHDPGAWTAVGDWQGWNNNNSATAMVDLGSHIYACEQALAPGWYQYKAVVTGTWDAIGADARSINADNYWFEVTTEAPVKRFLVDASTGTIKVETVPEPSSLAALATLIPLVAVIRKRR